MVMQQGQGNALLGTNPAALRAQIADVQARLAGLQEEYSRLQGQTQDGLTAFPIKTRESQIQLDIASGQGELARLNALAKSQGITPVASSTQPPRVHFYDRFDPDVVLGMSFVILMTMLLPLSVAMARRFWRGSPRRDPEAALVGSRMERLEHAVDSIAVEVERISEGQRYVTKLLAEQPSKSRVESGH
jgi:hypothetical protein